MKKGSFITFEGPEGSGKSTQIKRAAAFLKKRGHKVLVLREPGSTRISEAIRGILLNPKYTEMSMNAELLLYLAARAQLVQEKIQPALKRGITVISDRFEDSTLAYQGYGRKMNLHAILEVSRSFVRGNLKPDRTFLLTIDVKEGMKRGGRRDRMEKASLKFHRCVQQGFLKLAKRDSRCVVIDASQSIVQVSKKIQEVLS